MVTSNEKILDLRSRGYTQAEVGKRLYMSQAQVSRIEKGRTRENKNVKKIQARVSYSRGMSQQEIADDLRVSQPTISRWLKGYTSTRIKRGRNDRRQNITTRHFYQNDKTFTQEELAKDLGVSQSTISRRLKGVPKISRSKKPERDLTREIVDLRKSGLSQQAIAKQLKINQSTVSRYLKLSTRPKRSRIVGLSEHERARVQSEQRNYALNVLGRIDDRSMPGNEYTGKKIITRNKGDD